MRLIALSNLRDFWEAHPEAATGLVLWAKTVKEADWASMNDVQTRWPKAKVLDADRVRFPIAGGSYRLIAAFHFPSRQVWVKFVGTHAEYDRIDALTVEQF